jgi:enoyl-CoA hydratase/carnithine racemase
VLKQVKVPLKFNPTTLSEFEGQLLAALEEASCHTIVLCGAGTCFSTGMDLAYIVSAYEKEFLSQFIRILKIMKSARRPILAKVEGKAIGGGLALLAAADVVLASNDATFSLPEVSVGLTPTVVISSLLERMSSRDLKSFVWGNRALSASQAFTCGLVDKVVKLENLDEEANAWSLKVSRTSSQVIVETKQLLARLHDHDTRVDTGCQWLARRLEEPPTRAMLSDHLAAVQLFSNEYVEG